MSAITDTVPPRVDHDGVLFHVTDPAHRLAGVRLWQEIGLSRRQATFRRTAHGWMLYVRRPPVDRMEYLFEVRHADGVDLVLDAGNPARVGGAFGDHSVVEFPGYLTPWWLSAGRCEGRTRDVTLGTITARIWSPEDVVDDLPLPLLVAHDGPEYDDLAGLTTYSAALVAAGRLPMHRVVLLAPGDRNEQYSANPDYSAVLCEQVLPALEREVAVVDRPVGIGASLGALALLAAQRWCPGRFAALFLQSGSYFVPVYDHMEAGFARFGRIVRWVSATRRADRAQERLPVVLTCGAVEENLRNNRLMWRALAGQGYATRMVVNRDAHNYTAWRDCFDPHLTRLLGEVWHAG